MKVFCWTRIALLCFVTFGVVGSWAWGQTGVGTFGSDARVAPRADEDIPAAALLTDEGLQLARQLQSLRRTLSTLGPKHPSIEKVRSDIEAVKRQLAGFNAPSEEASGLGSQTAVASESATSSAQLHGLVLDMSRKIQQLETRVSVLERRLRAR